MGLLADLPGAWRREERRDGVSWHYPHNRQGRPGGQTNTFEILHILISSRFWKQKVEQEEEEELEFRLLFVPLCLASWWHPLFWGSPFVLYFLYLFVVIFILLTCNIFFIIPPIFQVCEPCSVPPEHDPPFLRFPFLCHLALRLHHWHGGTF